MVAIKPPESDSLVISEEHWTLMYSDVSTRFPEEACGLLGGVGCHVAVVFPITNILHSPVRYRMAPDEQLSSFSQLDQQGYELLAIYHSHPTGPDVPSPTDIAEAYYPDVVQLIWYKAHTEWLCKAYKIHNERIIPVALKVLKS